MTKKEAIRQFGAPVPPPPDYSTPAKVNARIREFCGTHWLNATDKSFGKLLKAFRAVVPLLPCPVVDTHVSKWEVALVNGELTLVPRRAPEPPAVKRSRPRRGQAAPTPKLSPWMAWLASGKVVA